MPKLESPQQRQKRLTEDRNPSQRYLNILKFALDEENLDLSWDRKTLEDWLSKISGINFDT